MIFEYSAEMGAPNKNRIVLSDKNCLFTEYDGEEYGCEKLFYVINLRSELSLSFSVEDGYLVGAHSGKLIFEYVPLTEIAIPEYMDGKLKAKSGGSLLLGGCDYLDFENDDVFYDRKNSLLAFGAPSEAVVTVRVCENLFVSLNEVGALAAVIVHL